MASEIGNWRPGAFQAGWGPLSDRQGSVYIMCLVWKRVSWAWLGLTGLQCFNVVQCAHHASCSSHDDDDDVVHAHACVESAICRSTLQAPKPSIGEASLSTKVLK